VFDAVALAGGYGLMRVLGAARVVALGTSAVYLLAPTTVGMLAFGGTFTGFTLLPTYALVDLLVMRALTSGRRNLMIGAAAGYAAVKTGALFLDGYSFVISALLSAALWMPWLLRGSVPRRTRALGLATLIGGHLIAVLAYELYAPRSSTRTRRRSRARWGSTSRRWWRPPTSSGPPASSASTGIVRPGHSRSVRSPARG
jgi:hypothetical protein